MKELELEVARYVGRHPYKATRLDEGDPEAEPRRVIRIREAGIWKLEITEQPPAAISIALGDVLTNLRASLDHIVARLAPGRDQNHFPLVVDSDEKGRKTFAKLTKGMPAEAIAFLEELQPYNFPPLSADGTPQIHPIRELCRLVNSDKHNSLIDLKCSLEHAWAFATLVFDAGGGKRLGQVQERGWYAACHDEGHTVADFSFNPLNVPPGAEVQVHVHGAPSVSLKIVEGYGTNDLLSLVRIALDAVHEQIFPGLEAHIPV